MLDIERETCHPGCGDKPFKAISFDGARGHSMS